MLVTPVMTFEPLVNVPLILGQVCENEKDEAAPTAPVLFAPLISALVGLPTV
jgi:hypothetical protein